MEQEGEDGRWGGMKIKFFAEKIGREIHFPICIRWRWYSIYTDNKKLHIISILFLCWSLEWRFIPKGR